MALGHGGLAFVVAGVTAISVWKVEAIQTQRPGEAVAVAGYSFTLLNMGSARGANYQTSLATVEVKKDDQRVALLFPERRWYPVERQPTTEAGIETLWHGDLYAVLGDPDGSGAWVTRYYYNPGVAWMWLGALLMALGGMISLCDRRLRVGVPRRAMRLAATASALLLLIVAAPDAQAIDPGESFADPAKEARARSVGKQLRCVVCQNQSLFDSNAGLARDLRNVVRERIEAGDTDQQAIDYIVARYGDYVLLNPPLKPATYVLWIAPILLFAGAALAARRYTRRQGQVPILSEQDRAEARRILEEKP
jgi:cytochrome c-type biogenesis protein CcmH/NrfF